MGAVLVLRHTKKRSSIYCDLCRKGFFSTADQKGELVTSLVFTTLHFLEIEKMLGYRSVKNEQKSGLCRKQLREQSTEQFKLWRTLHKNSAQC